MKLTCRAGLAMMMLLFIPLSRVSGQDSLRMQKKILSQLSQTIALEEEQSLKTAVNQAVAKGWPSFRHSKTMLLKGVDPLGFPVYFKTLNNTTAAATTQTNAVQAGGLLGLDLSGKSDFFKDRVAIWDEGIVYTAHQEFAGKSFIFGDTSRLSLDHVTHVAGTIMAQGVNPNARGMAFGLKSLLTYDFNNDASEMAAAAANLLVSNHSYGYVSGWDYNQSLNRWEWDGLPGDTVDYKFGFYTKEAQRYDQIAFEAPQYMIVAAAGNSHGETGPAIGDIYYGYNSKTDPTLVNKGPRPPGISDNNGFDVISSTANAKNVLTVGAVNPLSDGPSDKNSVQIASFSSWGPTDDGRIKPDICGDGVNVLSTGNGAPDSYYVSSGTSMATPNVSGSLVLLQEYYSEKNNGTVMRSATLKGLVCHTAFDAGNPGPDYIYGWGLLDTRSAAQLINDNGVSSLIAEQTLAQGDVQTYNVVASGKGPLKATICWTDPSAIPSFYGKINDRTPKLVNDLDLRITDSIIPHYPWVLNPDQPSAGAVTGDNIRDNIEQVIVDNPMPGKNYSVSISNKGKLFYGLQNYSLILSGTQSSTFNGPASQDISLLVYPVPASDVLNISLNTPNQNNLLLNLYNSNGQKVFTTDKQITKGAYTTKIPVGSLASGTYLLQVRLGDRNHFKKLILTNN